ncbi:MAG: YlxR family protein [Bifidobacteriaceae bacterium]|nr:YlxR family protein [Bifidobacteriaceae bacterium]
MNAPVRTCVGCHRRGPRSALVRVVLDPGAAPAALVLDTAARLPGRGAWVHPDPVCVASAVRHGAFSRALRHQGRLAAEGLADQIGQWQDLRPTESGWKADGHQMSAPR